MLPDEYLPLLRRYIDEDALRFGSAEFPLDLLVTPDPFLWRYILAVGLRRAQHRLSAQYGTWHRVYSTYTLLYVPGEQPTVVLVAQDVHNMEIEYRDAPRPPRAEPQKRRAALLRAAQLLSLPSSLEEADKVLVSSHERDT